MKKHSTKRALLLSALAMLLCLSMLVGSTFAWFTDSVVSSGNKIQAGTLDVQLLMFDGADYADISESSAPIFGTGSIAQNNNAQTLWEPGKTQVAYLAIRNNGTLALKYTVGLNVANVSKNLYEVMQYAITPDATADAPVTSWAGGDNVVLGSQVVSDEVSLAVGATHYFALSIHMMEEAGNEYQEGEVNFDLIVLAAQDTVEVDSFDNQYDKDATYPTFASGSLPVDGTTQRYELEMRTAAGQKVGSMEIPASAVAGDADELRVVVYETPVNPNVVLQTNEAARTFEIKVYGIKEGTLSEMIEVELDIGLDKNFIAVYHDTNLVPGAVYNPVSGHVIFSADSFSPYTIVTSSEAADNSGLPSDLPDANLTALNPSEFVVDGAWDWSVAPSKAQVLECVYQFSAPHDSSNIDTCKYADWICDFYVRMETEDGNSVPAEALTLGGYYEGFGWVGFENPMVDGNSDIPLLQSVATNPWTYRMIVESVGTFRCGVAHNDASVHGKTFTVMLRLVNPENEAEYYDVETVNYVFNCTETH